MIKRLLLFLFGLSLVSSCLASSYVSVNLSTIPGIQTTSSLKFQQVTSFPFGGPPANIGNPIVVVPTSGLILTNLAGGFYKVTVEAYQCEIQVPDDGSTNDIFNLIENKLTTTPLTRTALQQPSGQGVYTVLGVTPIGVSIHPPVVLNSTVNIDVSSANLFVFTNSGNVNVSFVNYKAGQSWEMHIVATGANTVTFVNTSQYGLMWPTAAPVQSVTPGYIDRYSFLAITTNNIEGAYLQGYH